MGRDKALLPHPTSSTWIEHALLHLAALHTPITVLSRWPEHLALAQALDLPQLELCLEPTPWEGPLLALHRLMQHHPDQQLLLCPVDMPWLNQEALVTLIKAARTEPSAIHLAHDGERCQPLLGVYPGDALRRHSLALAIQRGERRLQQWLAGEHCRHVRLAAKSIHNVNHHDELDRLLHP